MFENVICEMAAILSRGRWVKQELEYDLECVSDICLELTNILSPPGAEIGGNKIIRICPHKKKMNYDIILNEVFNI